MVNKPWVEEGLVFIEKAHFPFNREKSARDDLKKKQLDLVIRSPGYN